MTCALLSIGTELARGELINTNATWLAAELTAVGFEVQEHVVVSDDAERITEAVCRLSERFRVVVCTGGLGPTTDDVTTQAVATAIGAPLVRHNDSLEAIRRRFEKAGRVMSRLNEKQADFPDGADVLPNPIGTAPGFGVHIGTSLAFFLPGVPAEMKRMFDEQVVPRIRALAPHDSFQLRVHTFGLTESAVGERLEGIEEANPGVTIGYRAHFPEIEVKVLAHAASHASARDLCEGTMGQVRKRLGSFIYGEAEDTFGGVVGRVLRAHGWTLAIAESCTGGLVGHLLTREPGASDFLLLDAVTYANSAKSSVLGVDGETIRWHGAVSHEVAAAMAIGAKRVAGAHLGLSLTGIAGPSGGSDAKPVGTVFLALAGADGTLAVQQRLYRGDRGRIQTLAAYDGLQMVREVCSAPRTESVSDSSGGERRPRPEKPGGKEPS
jgi:nicotinamide-nucleotide amidase